MFAPANFYRYDYGHLNEVWGNTISTKNIPFEEATSLKVGSVWKKIFDKWIENAAPIVFGDVEQGHTVIGSGQWITKDLFLTCAHNLDLIDESFDIISHRGVSITVEVDEGYINRFKDFAIFKIQAPSHIKEFPPFAPTSNHLSQHGMIHFSSGSIKPHVTSGNPDATAHEMIDGISHIDGGARSSGACVFNDLGQITHLHRGRKKEFEGLRGHLPIQEILQDYQEHLDGIDTNPDIFSTHIAFDEIPEHYFFDCLVHTSSDIVKKQEFSTKVFNAARDLIFDVINNKFLDFYSKAQTASKTIYRYQSKDPILSSIRLDIQKPPVGYINIHIQCGETSIAGILLSKELSYFNQSQQKMIKSFVNFSLGKLLDCLYAAEHKVKTSNHHVLLARIDPKK